MNPTSAPAVNKHPEFYFSDIIFLVEDQLFRVPRRNFAVESEIFADMFCLPSPDGALPDGSSDSQPLRLEGIKKIDFVQLLRVMFPLHDCVRLNSEEWISVLRLSTMWQFNQIRAIAIKNLEELSLEPVDRAAIAKEFDVATWVVPAITALVQRKKPLDLGEGYRLGMEWALKVAELREWGTPGYSPDPTCKHCSAIGPPRCDACYSTSHTRCGHCGSHFPIGSRGPPSARGERNDVDYSRQIRKVFGL